MADGLRFDGKVVVVTGAGNGLGRSHALAFAKRGAKVVVNDLGGGHTGEGKGSAAADKVVDEIKAAGGTAVANYDSVEDGDKIIKTAMDTWGRIDVLVNNAGVIRDNLLVALEPDDVRTVLDTNVTGLFNVTRAVAPHMTAARSGRIVNLSSVSATRGGRGQTNYAASKGAIEAFTRALAVELAPRRIRVNAVAPGVIDTEMSKDVRELAGDEVLGRILLRRYGTAEDIAHAVWYLASDLAAYVTGTVLHVDGGFKME